MAVSAELKRRVPEQVRRLEQLGGSEMVVLSLQRLRGGWAFVLSDGAPAGDAPARTGIQGKTRVFARVGQTEVELATRINRAGWLVVDARAANPDPKDEAVRLLTIDGDALPWRDISDVAIHNEAYVEAVLPRPGIASVTPLLLTPCDIYPSRKALFFGQVPTAYGPGTLVTISKVVSKDRSKYAEDDGSFAVWCDASDILGAGDRPAVLQLVMSRSSPNGAPLTLEYRIRPDAVGAAKDPGTDKISPLPGSSQTARLVLVKISPAGVVKPAEIPPLHLMLT